MTSERVSQEESNKVNFSSMAPSGKELFMNAQKFVKTMGGMECVCVSPFLYSRHTHNQCPCISVVLGDMWLWRADSNGVLPRSSHW